jgi:hypothetical protein
MDWADFVPREGILCAEGSGQSLSATLIRGMGLVVEYNQEPGSRPEYPREMLGSMYVPSIAADKVRGMPANSFGMGLNYYRCPLESYRAIQCSPPGTFACGAIW